MAEKRKYEYDSRKVVAGDVFISLPKGEAYSEEALEKGASDIRSMTRSEMGLFASELFNHPSRNLTVIGVTGTNGKTTTCSLLTQALQTLGISTKQVGTLTSPLTTPESLDLHELMAEHLSNGGTHFVMEVSSHGIDQDRISGIDFDIKLLTNITQDHLDYHGSFDAYKACKLSWMNNENGEAIMPESFLSIDLPFDSPLLGGFNESNMKAAYAILRQLGISPEDCSKGLSLATAPPGRFESIDEGQSFEVIVDYAHTPDGLKNVLIAAKEMADASGSRVLTVFGCGGDRDRRKRPMMASVVSQFSDYFVLTSDNPRSESQSQITEDILSGLPDERKNYIVLEDRKEAIYHAISEARGQDLVMIAGKGHENYQILNHGTIDFDDREHAREALRSLK